MRKVILACRECGYETSIAVAYSEHIAHHVPSAHAHIMFPYMCGYCSYRAKEEAEITAHITVHGGELTRT